MDPLSFETQKYVQSALGYHELGLHEDSLAELDQVNALEQKTTGLILFRAQILNALGEYPRSVEHLRQYAANCADSQEYPILLAYATRRAHSLEEAKRILEDSLTRFSKEPLIHYNLACYQAQLGQFAESITLLESAIDLDPQYRSLAQKDPDFLPLKNETDYLNLMGD